VEENFAPDRGETRGVGIKRSVGKEVDMSRVKRKGPLTTSTRRGLPMNGGLEREGGKKVLGPSCLLHFGPSKSLLELKVCNQGGRSGGENSDKLCLLLAGGTGVS